MSTKQPDESLSVYDTGRNLSEVINRVRLQSKHVEITRNGTPAAMVVPVDWWGKAAAAAEAPEINASELCELLDKAAFHASNLGNQDDATAYKHLATLIADKRAVVVL